MRLGGSGLSCPQHSTASFRFRRIPLKNSPLARQPFDGGSDWAAIGGPSLLRSPRHRDQLGQLPQVLGGGGEQELVLRPVRSAQAQTVEPQDLACLRVRTASGLERAGVTAELARPVPHEAVFIDPVAAFFQVPSSAQQLFATRAGVEIAIVVVGELCAAECPVLPFGIVEDRDVRLDALLVDQPPMPKRSVIRESRPGRPDRGSGTLPPQFLDQLRMAVEEPKQLARWPTGLDESTFVLAEGAVADLEQAAGFALRELQLLSDPPDGRRRRDPFDLFLQLPQRRVGDGHVVPDVNAVAPLFRVVSRQIDGAAVPLVGDDEGSHASVEELTGFRRNHGLRRRFVRREHRRHITSLGYRAFRPATS